MNWKELSKKEQLALYKQCKELYNTSSESPLEDFEYDELEEALGLANKGKSAARTNPKYTVEHPVTMGSLSKVQIKKSESGVIDWDKYYKEVSDYIYRNYTDARCLVTPKFDGCSFEINVHNRKVTVSGRGDGNFGPDYSKVLDRFVSEIIVGVTSKISMTANIVMRGEVLIDKNVFTSKYSKEADPEHGFKNPRSFVSGVLNRDYDEKDLRYLEMISDLSVVIYDIKTDYTNGDYSDIDWTFLQGIVPAKYLPNYYMHYVSIESAEDLKNIYIEFEHYRNVCPFALDGIVIKPTERFRKYNSSAYRPKDCVAIKFMPMMDATEVVDIDWKLGKTGEYFPTIITKPVVMDGKDITRASASNYGKLINEKISIGTKVVLSLAGDIIPFIYKVDDTSAFDETMLNIPTEYETYVIEGNDGVKHLMAVLSEDDKKKVNFMASVSAINIPGIGGSSANSIWEQVSNVDENVAEFFELDTVEVPDNILMCNVNDIILGIGGKNGEKAGKAFNEVIGNLTLKEIITSCNFRFCGKRVAEQIEHYLLNESYDFASMAKEGYEWVFDNHSANFAKITEIMEHLGYSIDYFIDRKKVISENSVAPSYDEQIPVILTGEPNDYASKGEFLKCNPQYRMTGKWTEVKIVFTNSLDSNTGKMKKAREKGIEIRLY